ncbi:MAG TPA: polysaccharide deacetylase family protein [Dehalococcoidia bacterium]|nr:polysaccharide deacetylase family protein [Dehalococcoidia bacterium]
MGSNNRHNLLQHSALKDNKIACLTLDLESDHSDLLDEPRYEGLEHIPELVAFLGEAGVPLTCFVQGSLLETHQGHIQLLTDADVEFELHSYSHPDVTELDTHLEVERGIEAYRKFFARDPLGYRSPLGIIKEEDYDILAANGFRFDSSIYPSLRPGVFNNLGKPIQPFRVDVTDIVEFPFTAFSSLIRVPLTVSYLKLLGWPYFFLIKTFPLPDLIVFAFHLHDLFRLSSSREIPLEKHSLVHKMAFKRIYNGRHDGLLILKEFVETLRRKGYSFNKLFDVYEAICLREEPVAL